MEALLKLTKDIKNTANTLTDNEARYIVDTYYQIQEYRKRTNNQIRAVDQQTDDAPHETLQYFADNFTIMENNMKKVLKAYAESKPNGQG